VARKQHELEPVLDLVEAIFDGHAGHARLLSGCFGGGGKRAMYTQTPSNPFRSAPFRCGSLTRALPQ